MKYIQFIKEHNLKDCPIRISCNEFTDKDVLYRSISIEGDFPETEPEYRHFKLYLMRSVTDMTAERLNALQNPILKQIEVAKEEDNYHVELVIADDEGELHFTTWCYRFSASGWHYLGFDETNVYGTPEYDAYRERFFYAEQDAYFDDEKTIELPDGYSFVKKAYIHRTERAVKAYFERCQFCKNGECLYEYVSIDGHHGVYKDFIQHRNGHRYYPFHVDLYGISYLDVDTLEVFHYIPRGYDNDYGLPCGESFIITDIHYDPQSNLIAYGGCFWAGLSDVMVGDFSDPLCFDPHFVHICKLVEFKNDDDNDIDFAAWEAEGLRIQCESPVQSFFSADMLHQKIHEQT